MKGRMYSRLPRTYRANDTADGQLRRFVQVFEEALEQAYDTTIFSITDPLECPVEYLQVIAKSMGYKLNPNLSEAQQRRILDALPYLIEHKGTDKCFNAIAKELFGKNASVKLTKPTYSEGMIPTDYRKVRVQLGFDVSGAFGSLDESVVMSQFMYDAEQFRPINYELQPFFEMICIEEHATVLEYNTRRLLPQKFVRENYGSHTDLCSMANGSDAVEIYDSHDYISRLELIRKDNRANEFVAF